MMGRLQVAVRIKTDRGRGGIMQDIAFSGLDVIGTPLLLSFNMNYEKHQTKKLVPVLRNVVISNISARNIGRAGILACLPESPCTGITLHNITISGLSAPFKCENAFGHESALSPHSGCVLSA